MQISDQKKKKRKKKEECVEQILPITAILASQVNRLVGFHILSFRTSLTPVLHGLHLYRCHLHVQKGKSAPNVLINHARNKKNGQSVHSTIKLIMMKNPNTFVQPRLWIIASSSPHHSMEHHVEVVMHCICHSSRYISIDKKHHHQSLCLSSCLLTTPL